MKSMKSMKSMKKHEKHEFIILSILIIILSSSYLSFSPSFSSVLPGSLPYREGGRGYVRRDRLCEITSKGVQTDAAELSLKCV